MMVFEATTPAGIVLYGRLVWKETEVESYLPCLLEMASGMWYHPKHARKEKGPRVPGGADKNHATETAAIKQQEQQHCKLIHILYFNTTVKLY